MNSVDKTNKDLREKLAFLPVDDEFNRTIEEYSIKAAWHNIQYAQQHAIIPKDKKTKVGAVILGQSNTRFDQKFFWGCNIKLSESHVYHAEIVALLSCLKEHYRPAEIFVTSRSMEENIHCCLDCRGRLIETNPEIICTVFNPDGSIKHRDKLIKDCQFVMETESCKIDWDVVFKHVNTNGEKQHD